MHKDRQQNSTNHPIPFRLVSSTDHVTAVTGATVTVQVSKDGAGSWTTASGTVTEVGNGLYWWNGNATDRATLGAMLFRCTATGADDFADYLTIVAYDPSAVLPTANANSAGGLIGSGTGTGQLSVTAGVASSNVTQVLGSANVPQLWSSQLSYTGTLAAQTGATSTQIFVPLAAPTMPASGGWIILAQNGSTPPQVRTVTNYIYNGTYNVATLSRPWDTQPALGWTINCVAVENVALDSSLNALANVKTTAATLSFNNTGQTTPEPDTAGTTTLLARLTSARSGYLDNLNVGGVVASHADIAAINQSASKHLILQSVGQFEPGETYTIEMRTFAAADGSAVNADTTPTLTATGNVSGSLSANLSAATNPATGLYRWTYTPGATPTLEQIRFDGSPTIGGATFTLSCYSQTVDFATAVFTATDQSHLTTIFNQVGTMASGVNVSSWGNSAVQKDLNGLPSVNVADWDGAMAPSLDANGNLPANVVDWKGAAAWTYLAPTNLTAAQIATAIWQDATAGDFTVANSVGKVVYGQLGGAFTSGTSIFTVSSLQNAPSGGGGGGATVAQIVAALAGQSMIVISPVGTGQVTINRGNAYALAYNNQLDFTLPTNATWPADLTGYAINFTATKAEDNPNVGASAINWTMSIVTASGSSQKIRLQLTTAQTSALALSDYAFKITGQPPASTDVVPLLTGALTVNA